MTFVAAQSWSQVNLIAFRASGFRLFVCKRFLAEANAIKQSCNCIGEGRCFVLRGLSWVLLLSLLSPYCCRRFVFASTFIFHVVIAVFFLLFGKLDNKETRRWNHLEITDRRVFIGNKRKTFIHWSFTALVCWLIEKEVRRLLFVSSPCFLFHLLFTSPFFFFYLNFLFLKRFPFSAFVLLYALCLCLSTVQSFVFVVRWRNSAETE